jgi:TolB protein
MNADGSEATNLTRNPADDGSGMFTWSMDGRYLPFVTTRDGNREIYIMNSDGSNPRNLTQTPKAEEDDPVWLPDGRILFVGNREGNWDLFAMNRDGSGLINLTHDPADDMRSLVTYNESGMDRKN